MSAYDMDSRDLRMAAFDRLVEHAADLRRSGRHEHVDAATLTREFRLLAATEYADRVSDAPGRWVADPEVNNVWGWIDDELTPTGRVAVVYYRHEADLECDGDWELAAATAWRQS